jgi:hypothetical protein
MDDKVIKINLAIFQNRYNNIIEVPENIISKAENLKKSCNCFNSFYDPKMIWEKKLFNKKEKHAINNANGNNSSSSVNNKSRVHIIIPDFSDISNTKRTLIGYLNKLTIKNKEVIYEKIKNIIHNNATEEVFLIIWSYIKATGVAKGTEAAKGTGGTGVSDSDNNLYIRLLEYFDAEFSECIINKLWESYKKNKEWLPPKYIFDNNLLLLNNEYELYCDYIKWKKGIHNLNTLWVKYKPNDIPLLLNDIYEYMTNCINNPTIHKYIIDIFMEQILKILKNYNDTSIIDKIKRLDIKTFESSTKFLIYNIIEK